MYNLHLWILFVSLQMAGYFESLLAVIKQEDYLLLPWFNAREHDLHLFNQYSKK